MFKIVPKSEDTARPFSLTVGLREGYDDAAKTHDIAVVRAAALAWMGQKAARGELFLTGVLREGEVLYAYPKEAGQSKQCYEPVAEFTGIVSTLYNSGLTDEQCSQLLNELGELLAAATNQTRVYVVFRDRTWVLQCEGKATPRGDTV